MSLLVLEPGLASRLVDDGRPRSRSLGVPVGGAADRRSLAIGNALLGNPPDAAALEICLQGPHLRAETDVACVLFGAPFDMRLDGASISAQQTFSFPAGAVLQIGGTSQGVRAYLCVRRGFNVPIVLASRSGLQPLRQGEILPCMTSELRRRFCPELEPTFPDRWSIRVLPGPQADWFDEGELYQQTFLASRDSDRMGLRLDGKPLTMPGRELLSEPVCPGAVQVIRNGQCIVLGVDGQTIGGYPKIAQVIQADLDALGQIRPDQRLRFLKVCMDDAIRAARTRGDELRLWTSRLRLSLDAFPSGRG